MLAAAVAQLRKSEGLPEARDDGEDQEESDAMAAFGDEQLLMEKSDKVIEAELWNRRSRVVDNEIRETTIERQRLATEAANEHHFVKDMILRKHAKKHEEVDQEYEKLMWEAMCQSGFERVSPRTHGTLVELLQTMPEAVKRSAHYARDITSCDRGEGEARETHRFQARSAYTGCRNFEMRAYAPKTFVRIRENLGIGFNKLSRALQVDASESDSFFACGDFFLTKASDICMKLISTEEREEILNLLEAYELYTVKHPYTFLPQWLAIVEGWVVGQSPKTILVTKNFLHTLDPIDVLLDMKGSYKRTDAENSKRGGRDYQKPLNAHGIDTAEYTIDPPKILHDHEIRHALLDEGSPVVLHKEERELVLRTLRNDTDFLAEQGVYGYALIIGVHTATPWDPPEASYEEMRHTRFGGFDVIEDRMHVSIAGPMKVWSSQSRMMYAANVMRGRLGGSTVPPEQYAARLRELAFALVTEYGETVNYKVFRKMRIRQFEASLEAEDPVESVPAEKKVKKVPQESAHFIKRQPCKTWKRQSSARHAASVRAGSAMRGRGFWGGAVEEEGAAQERGVRRAVSFGDEGNSPKTTKDGGKGVSWTMDTKASTVDTKASTVDTKASTVDTKASTVDTKASTVDNKASTVDTKGLMVFTKYSSECPTPLPTPLNNRSGKKLHPALVQKRFERRKMQAQKTLGLGLKLGASKRGGVFISHIEPGRSADASQQVFVGDKLLAVARVLGGEWEWVEVDGVDIQSIAALMQGEEDELLNLRLLRKDTKETEEVVLRLAPEPSMAFGNLPQDAEEWDYDTTVTTVASKQMETLQMMLDKPPIKVTSALEVMTEETSTLRAEEALKTLDELGAFCIYRTSECTSPEGRPFMAFVVAYMPDYGIVQHNVLYMVKCELMHLSKTVEWSAYNHWVTIHPQPWLLKPQALHKGNEIFPSILQFVATQPQLRVFCDLANPPPPRVIPVPPKPKMQTVQITLHDKWVEMHGAELGTGDKRLLTDMKTGAPLHVRQAVMRPHELSSINLQGSEVAKMVDPYALLEHLKGFYPREVKAAAIHLKKTVDKNEETIAMARAAEAQIRGGRADGVLKRGYMWKLNSNVVGEPTEDDWRERLFLIADGVLSYVSEHSAGKPKTLGDLRNIVKCLLIKCHPFTLAMELTWYGKGKDVVRHVISPEEDERENLVSWLSNMGLYSGHFAKPRDAAIKEQRIKRTAKGIDDD